jgi:hypothetical protein
MAAIEARVSLFRELHRNWWYHQFNCVLWEMMVPEASRRPQAMYHDVAWFNAHRKPPSYVKRKV